MHYQIPSRRRRPACATPRSSAPQVERPAFPFPSLPSTTCPLIAHPPQSLPVVDTLLLPSRAATAAAFPRGAHPRATSSSSAHFSSAPPTRSVRASLAARGLAPSARCLQHRVLPFSNGLLRSLSSNAPAVNAPPPIDKSSASRSQPANCRCKSTHPRRPLGTISPTRRALGIAVATSQARARMTR